MRLQVDIPAPYNDPPVFDSVYNIYFSAWNELSSSRQRSPDGVIVYDIARKDVIEYARERGWNSDREFMDQLHLIVKRLDDVFVLRENKRIAKIKERLEKKAQRKQAKLNRAKRRR